MDLRAAPDEEGQLRKLEGLLAQRKSRLTRDNAVFRAGPAEAKCDEIHNIWPLILRGESKIVIYINELHDMYRAIRNARILRGLRTLRVAKKADLSTNNHEGMYA
jgi:hypothetical protein